MTPDGHAVAIAVPAAPPAVPAPPRTAALRRRGLTRAHLVGVALLAAGAVLATLDAWADIVRIAVRDEEQSHVFLVPVVVAWLVWVRRERLRTWTPGVTWVGPPLVLLGWFLHRSGDTNLVEASWHLGALLVLVGAFLSVAGGTFFVRFVPAFVALCFLVPVPGLIRQAIALPLQAATAAVTQAALDTFGVPAERLGNTLRVNGHDVAIVEACNGLRMVFALVMVTFAFAYGVPLRNGVRLFVLLATPLLAIAFNVVRLVPTVWAYGYLETTTADAVHDVTGWLVPPLAFLTLLGIVRVLRWAQVPITPYVLAHA